MDKKKLAEDNHKLIHYFLKKYNLKYEDWYDIVAIGYMQAVKIYDEDKGQFSPLAIACMKNQYAMERGKMYNNTEKAFTESISGNTPTFTDTDGNSVSIFDMIPAEDSHLDGIDLKLALEEFLKKTTYQRREVLLMRAQGYTTTEIADKLGCTKSNVSHITLRAKAEFKKFINGFH